MIHPSSYFKSEIPSHWRVAPFWTLFKRNKKTGFPDEELLSVYRDYGVIPKSSRDDNHNVASEDLSGYQLVTEGSLVTNKMKAWQGSIAISRHQGIVSPAYYVYEPLSKEHDQYLHYLFRSRPYIALYQRISKGVRVGQWDLEHEALRTIPVLLPDLSVQKDIADFLDRETARIDQLIEKKKQFNELSVIKFETLRNKIIRQKTSGFPLQPLRWLTRVSSGKFIDNSEISEEKTSSLSTPVIGGNGPLGFTSEVNSKANTLVVGRVGALCGNVHYIPESCWVTDNALIITFTSKKIHPLYAYEILVAENLNKKANKSAQPLITGETVKDVKVCLPSETVQSEIVSEIAGLREHFSKFQSQDQASVSLLKEYKTALITAAVTGQIDVKSYGKSGAVDRHLDQLQDEGRA